MRLYRSESNLCRSAWVFAALALGFAMYFAVATGFGDVPSY